MRILIIGGTGLIGTGITSALLERGHELIHFNRGGGSGRDVRQVVGDRGDRETFERRMAELGPLDCVIDMIGFERADVDSAVRAFRGRIGQYVFCSTVDVYTKPALSYPVDEAHERNPSRAFAYAYGKAQCEEAATEAHGRGDFRTTILRPAATYGGAGAPVHAFRGGTYHYDRIRKGKPIIVHGDGSAIWVSCHRDDVAKAFANAAGNPAAYGKAYNVAGNELLTWQAYWRAVARAMNAPEPRFVRIPTDLLGEALPNLASWCVTNFQYNNLFDNAAAEADLDFRPTVRWEDGVRGMIEEALKNGGFENSDDYPFYDRLIELWESARKTFIRDALPLDSDR